MMSQHKSDQNLVKSLLGQNLFSLRFNANLSFEVGDGDTVVEIKPDSNLECAVQHIITEGDYMLKEMSQKNASFLRMLSQPFIKLTAQQIYLHA